MAFGIQTFNEDGGVDFDSNSPLMKVIHKRRVAGSVSFTINDYAPPYYVVILAGNSPIAPYPSDIRWSQIGNTVNIQYVRYQLGSGAYSTNLPALVMVCK